MSDNKPNAKVETTERAERAIKEWHQSLNTFKAVERPQLEITKIEPSYYYQEDYDFIIHVDLKL